MQAPRLIHWAMLGFLSLAWGFSFSLIAVGLESFSPLFIVNMRLAVGALTLYLVMRWQGLSLPPLGIWWSRFVLLSIAGNLIPFLLITWAETRISSAQAGLLMALMPISTMVLSHFFVHGDVLTGRRLLGIATGFAGVCVLIGGDVLSLGGNGTLIAQGAVLIATLAYAVNTVYTKRLPPINTLALATGSLLIGSLILLPYTVYSDQPQWEDVSFLSMASSVLLGVVSTGLASWVYFRVVTDCGPSFLSIINYIIPAIAFAAGVLFLNETAVPSQFLGLVFVLMGIALCQQRAPAAADTSPK